ncbi:MAG: DUF4118 domain-containing protein [Bulleidia sp.]
MKTGVWKTDDIVHTTHHCGCVTMENIEGNGVFSLNEYRKYAQDVKDLLTLIAVVGIVTLLGLLSVQTGVPETNVVVIYIFAVLLVARYTTGYFYGILASVICLLCFNYFFTAPYHTLQVNDPSYMITFLIMLVTAVITGTLTTKEKMMTMEATRKGMESQTLYQLSSRLSDAADIETVAGIAAESISHLLQVNVGCVYTGTLVDPVYIQQVGDTQIHRSTGDLDELRGRATDLRTDYIESDGEWMFSVNGQNRLMAVILIDGRLAESQLCEKRELIHSMIENIALALERIEITMERSRDRQKMERESERANLLRSISHDLRTPLSGIMGSAEMLMDMMDQDDPKQKLLQGIHQDADWLKSLVENILSLTRLQDGKILVHKEMEALEEVIDCAAAHVEKNHPGRIIQVEIPDDFRMVPMDAGLIEQVMINLLDNAVKHTTLQEAITVRVTYTDACAEVSVMDEGEGIAKEDEGNLFQIFYTSKTRAADVKKGIGLGLTICETVVKAHGGTITGRNRTDRKGAEFIFTLPLREEK